MSHFTVRFSCALRSEQVVCVVVQSKAVKNVDDHDDDDDDDAADFPPKQKHPTGQRVKTPVNGVFQATPNSKLSVANQITAEMRAISKL